MAGHRQPPAVPERLSGGSQDGLLHKDLNLILVKSIPGAVPGGLPRDPSGGLSGGSQESSEKTPRVRPGGF